MKNLTLFQKFIRLCAGRAGSECNMFEIKSSQTFNAKYFDSINKVSVILGDRVKSTSVIYDGDDMRESKRAGIYNWRELFSEGSLKLSEEK